MATNKFLVAFTLLLVTMMGSRPSVSQTNNLTAKSIIERMAAQYANASSYQDTGIVEGSVENQRQTIIEFKTYFARPQLFRFEWIDLFMRRGKERINIVWNDGKQTYSYYSWSAEGVEKNKNLSLGIAGATGISRGAAHLIPALLMEEIGGFRLTASSKLSLLGEETFEGEDCYLIRGYHPFNLPIDMWIGKQSFLLRKIKETNEDGTYKVDIRRNIKLNEKIPAEMFRYAPPQTMPKEAATHHGR